MESKLALDISDILRDQGSLPLDWNASGKALMELADSDDTLLNLRTDLQKTSSNESCSSPSKPMYNAESGKKSLRITSNSMPDLSAHFGASRRNVPTIEAGRQVSTNSLATGRSSRASSGTSNWIGRHFTLKDYERELDEFRKENFNLKIRIWHLENEFQRRAYVTDDVGKRDSESQLNELTSKLDEKERMLKESLQVLNQLKANCNRRVSECEREHKIEMEDLKRHFVDRINVLEDALRSANERLRTSESENWHSNQLANEKRSLGGESDSDISLLSQRERQIFDLKTRVAVLERALNTSTSDGETDGTKTLHFEDMQIQALKDELHEKDQLLTQMRSRLDANETVLAELKADRNRRVVTLESKLADTNEFKNRLDAENQRLKARLDGFVGGNKRPVNNSDDEKLRQLEKELHVERTNTWKHMRIIEILIRELRNENSNVFDRLVGDVSSNGLGNIDGCTTFVDWLNDASALRMNQDDLLRRRTAELQSAGETLSHRLNRIVDHLEEYVSKLRVSDVGVDSSILRAFSDDISRLRSDVNESLENTTRAIVDALATRESDTSARLQSEMSRLADAISKRNETSFNISQVQDRFVDEPSGISQLNFLNLPEASFNGNNGSSGLLRLEMDKSIQTDPVELIARISSPSISNGHMTKNTDSISKTDYDALLKEKEKYERYAKKLKSMYRELVKCSAHENASVLERFLEMERRQQDAMDDVVRRLEENTHVLGERIDDHERCEKKFIQIMKKRGGKVKD